jgi:DNA-binding NtrC family response regulator
VSDSTEAIERESHFVVSKARVRVVEGPDKGAEAVATSTELSIGTGEGNDLTLTDPTVSRHHVSIELEEGGARVVDLASTNGIRFAGRRVQELWIKPDDEFNLGRSVLRLVDSGQVIREPLSADSSYGDVLGTSQSMRRLFSGLPAIASSSSTVLLEGETGCGKSLVARTLHRNGPRSEEPFVVVDCGAIPHSLIESELFGHEKGAFTGADSARAGAFRSAHKGTLLLEEVGELALDMQPRLLRALEERCVSPVGSDKEYKFETRIIAATNRDLRKRVNEGHFRSDLYYRLNVLKLRIPPLRERRDDIPSLLEYFFRELGDVKPSEQLVARMSERDWPGNVRELRAAVERILVLGDLVEETSPVANFRAPAFGQAPQLTFRVEKERATSEWERDFLSRLIEAHDGNVSAASRSAKMDRNHLRELLLRHGIDYRSKRKL